MPLVEIGVASKPTEWIKLRKSSGKVSLSKSVREKWFRDKRVRTFIDVENSLLGLQPSEEGYKINVDEGTFSAKPLTAYNIKRGVRFAAEWKDEHQMVVAKIKFDK